MDSARVVVRVIIIVVVACLLSPPLDCLARSPAQVRVASSEYISGFLASYYDIPWVSLRPLITHVTQTGAFQWTDVFCSPQQANDWECDAEKS